MLPTAFDPAQAYPLLKSIHIALVSTSVALFAARGLAVLAGAHWPMHPVVKRGSVLIDSALLLAGVGLWWMLGHPWSGHSWLAIKLLLLPLYVVLGAWTLKRAPTWWGRALCLVLALVTVAHMVGVAVTKQPAGWLGSVGLTFTHRTWLA
jgi:uncharacterized membrane protein SirB2